MIKKTHLQLSRRERQIMEIVYKLGNASAADVQQAMPDPPGYSAVRALLRLLEEKKQLKHKKVGRKYVFLPTVDPEQASRSALKNLMHTFFDNSVEQAVASLLDLNAKKLTQEDLDRLQCLIDQAREERKP
ncbi:MAG: BlaI/MecI/CopY family transcriptional regulator [Planctomycetota bacterium]